MVSVPVSLTSVSDSHDDNQENLITYVVENAIVTYADAVGVLTSRELLHSGRTRVIGQGINFPAYSPEYFSGEGF